MRRTIVTVHTNQRIEIFFERRINGFELWVVGPVKGQRTLLDHHLTHDDLEARLHYAQPGDLVWSDAALSWLPTEKHQGAIEGEETIGQGTFWDYDDPRLDEMEALARQVSGLAPCSTSHRSVAGHLASIAFLVTGKKEMEAAKSSVLGRWTDGMVTLSFKCNHKLGWFCTDRQHPLNVGERVHGHTPDWWNFDAWRIALMNNEHQCGTHVGVLHVDEQQLHLDGTVPHQIAHVFKRIGRAKATTTREVESVLVKPRKVKRVAAATMPLLRQLERTIIRRNPLFAERLKPGLPKSDIRETLNLANVTGAIEPLIELYSWRNGTMLNEQAPLEETSFLPVDTYQFLDLEAALNHRRSINQAAAQLREMLHDTEAHGMFSGVSGQLFPLFFDGSTGTIALDLTPSQRNRVVLIEFESTEPVRRAYDSFDEFLKDGIRANEENDSLVCFQ